MVVPVFPGDRAMELLERQVEFGPRVPGSEAHGEALEWMVSFLDGVADRVSQRPFTLHSPLTGETVPCRNIVASGLSSPCC